MKNFRILRRGDIDSSSFALQLAQMKVARYGRQEQTAGNTGKYLRLMSYTMLALFGIQLIVVPQLVREH